MLHIIYSILHTTYHILYYIYRKVLTYTETSRRVGNWTCKKRIFEQCVPCSSCCAMFFAAVHGCVGQLQGVLQSYVGITAYSERNASQKMTLFASPRARNHSATSFCRWRSDLGKVDSCFLWTELIQQHLLPSTIAMREHISKSESHSIRIVLFCASAREPTVA